MAGRYWENAECKICDIRMRLGLSMADLAFELGVSYDSVRKWENGKQKPTNVVRLALIGLEVEIAMKKKARKAKRGAQ